MAEEDLPQATEGGSDVGSRSAPEPTNANWTRWLMYVWIAAALIAVINAAVWVADQPGQAEIMAQKQKATEVVMGWIARLPPQDRFLIAYPNSNAALRNFGCDIVYQVYPRRSEVHTAKFPSDASARFDTILAIGDMRTNIPNDWQRTEEVSPVVLARRPNAPPTGDPVPTPRRIPAPLGLVCAVASLGVVYVIGAMLLACTLRKAPFDTWPGNLAAAHLTGAAALAWVATAWMMLTHKVSPAPIYGGVIVLSLWYRYRRRWSIFDRESVGLRGESMPTSDSAQVRRWVLGFALAAVLLCSVARGNMIAIGGDAARIWQFKARAFWFDGSDAVLRTPEHRSMKDYPVLVPIQSWWTYLHYGDPEPVWAQMIATLFFLDVLFLFEARAARWVPTDLRRLALIILAAPPIVLEHASSGWADMPFAAYFLALGIALVRLIEESDRSDVWLAAWLAAGIVATKNEGLQALVGTAALMSWYGWRRCDRIAYRSAAIVLGAGCAAYLPWFAIKHSLRLTTDLFDRSRIAAPSLTAVGLMWRMGYALWHGFVMKVGAIAPSENAWGLATALIVAGIACFLVRRGAPDSPLWGFAGLQIAGYIGIYMITPLPIVWHVNNSSDRLLLHVFPALLLASLAACHGGRATTGRLSYSAPPSG